MAARGRGSAMRICGKGSVMEALFTRKSIGSIPIPDFLHISFTTLPVKSSILTPHF